MRPRDTLTPEQEHDLEAIDRALAGAPVEYELREVEELVLDIRATAPQMSPAFAARLEHEVSEGFPASRQPPARVGRPGRRWLLLPAVGSLAAVLVALVVVLGSTDGGGSGEAANSLDSSAVQTEPESPAARAIERDEAAGASSGASASSGGARADRSASPSAKPVPPGTPFTPAKPAPAVAPTQAARKVQRSASIALETPQDDFDETTAAVNATVARFDGIVASAQVGESDASGGEATYDLRIPTDRLDRALAALAKLGHVTDRSQGLQDITGSFTSAQDRLTDARAGRRGLLRALARATTQAKIDSLKAQLRSVGSQISAFKGQLASLRRRADLARVDLTVRATGESTGIGAGGTGHPAMRPATRCACSRSSRASC